MASFSAGTTFTDGVANDVTAAKLGALVNNATPTSGLIQDRTAETVTATNDTLLIGDASDSNNLKRITVANFAQTLPTAKVTTGTIDTATLGTTTGTAATFTTGTITTLTAGTTTSTAATITTGTIPTLVATTLVTTGTGTASTPAIVPTGDTNTGIFFPAADTIAFSEGGTESMRIDSSGNVGIGTSSPNASYNLSLTGNGSTIIGGLALTSAGTTYIGAPSANSSAFEIWNSADNYVRIGTNNTERLRITSGGFLKASDTGTYLNSAADYHELRNSSSNEALIASNSNSVPYGIQIRFSSAPNNTTSYFLGCNDGNGTTNRAIIRSNGGIANFSANNVNLSDERLKDSICPAPSYLNKICSIPVVNYKYKDQTHDDYNLGVIAQQVESVCPELVDVDGFGETPEDGVPLKAIYQTDLQYALMKCIQELKAENDNLKARIEALEAA